MGHALLSQDGLATLCLGIVVLAVLIAVGWPLTAESKGRIVLIAGVAVIPYALRTAWKIPAVRLALYKHYYRWRGPTFEVQAGGTLQAIAVADESALLDRGLATARKVYTTAKADVRLANRAVIKAGRSRTIRLDVPQDWVEEEDGADGTDGYESESKGHRIISFHTWGYDGKVSRIEEVLENEIAPFFDELITAVDAAKDGRNFWLTITMRGTNPFLAFYLQDVPRAEVHNFQLDLTDVIAGDAVHIAIRKDGFRVAANNPRGLVGSAKTYLSTPALAHRNGD